MRNKCTSPAKQVFPIHFLFHSICLLVLQYSLWLFDSEIEISACFKNIIYVFQNANFRIADFGNAFGNAFWNFEISKFWAFQSAEREWKRVLDENSVQLQMRPS